MSTIPFRIFSVPVVLAGLLVISGCQTTETRWAHAEIPAEEWGVDASQCRWEARKKANREADEEVAYQMNASLDDSQSIESMMLNADINNRARELFDRCMRSLGYAEVE